MNQLGKKQKTSWNKSFYKINLNLRIKCSYLQSIYFFPGNIFQVHTLDPAWGQFCWTTCVAAVLKMTLHYVDQMDGEIMTVIMERTQVSIVVSIISCCKILIYIAIHKFSREKKNFLYRLLPCFVYWKFFFQRIEFFSVRL